MEISSIQTIYFIGIGGIGMSALARYFNDKGVEVHGYDITASSLTKKLEEEGMQIHYEENVKLIPENIDIVVYTPAIPQDHAELVWLLSSEIPVYKRSEMLGLITKPLKTIAVAGTHGKTSTSSIIAFLLNACGLDCTAFLGGILKNWNSNYVLGQSEYAVVEADEFDRSFLQLYPSILIVLSLDADHLDIYGDHATMIAAYEELTDQVKSGGLIIIQQGLKESFTHGWIERMTDMQITVLEFNTAQNSVISLRSDGFETAIKCKLRGQLQSWSWNVPGDYNAANALVALLVGQHLGIDTEVLCNSLSEYEGVKRRMELVLDEAGGMLIDDYAHHPKELEVAIGAIRELFPQRKITGIFQPHLYTRTRDHFKGFAQELSKLDEAYILPIYPARELPIPGITSAMIAETMDMKHAFAVEHNGLEETLLRNKHDIIVTLGAGNLDKHHLMLKKMIRNNG